MPTFPGTYLKLAHIPPGSCFTPNSSATIVNCSNCDNSAWTSTLEFQHWTMVIVGENVDFYCIECRDVAKFHQLLL